MKRILFLGLLAVIFHSCKNKTDKEVKDDGFTITGKINGLPTGAVKLISLNEDTRTSKTVDSISYTNDTFTLKGKVDYPQMMTITFEPGNWALHMFVENGQLQLKVDTSGSEHYDWTKYGGSVGAELKNYTVQGSKNQDDWMKYQNDPGQKQYDSVYAPISRAIMAEKDKDKEYKLRDQADSIGLLSNKWRLKWIQDFATKNPSSAAGIYMFYQLSFGYPNMPVPDVDSTLKLFNGEAASTAYYKSLDTMLNKRKALLPGNIAPDFTLLKRDSSKFTLSSSRGKYVMLDFWASWCHPCRQAIPHWKKVYAQYHPRGFDMISISDDNVWKSWFKAMDIEKMPWLQICDEFPNPGMPAKVGTLYMTAYIPFYVLLDKEGKIILYTSNEGEIDARLKELLG